ncbi:MAG TPA: aminopeptidase P family protein [Rhabdaerophilum sp.]|nr:aminopeptidase P family protein [Rhabdaerophilum sp.]
MHAARFQHFTTVSRPDLSAPRIASLRARLKAQKLHGLLLPRADIFQGEYLPPSEDRLAWLTGFTGSAGFCIVLERRAALFVDGRYTAQARAEVDRTTIQPVALASRAPEKWLEAHARKGGKIGYDPALFTERSLTKFREAAERAGFSLSPLADDPFDAIWPDRPPAPATPVRPHEITHAGLGAAEKLTQVEKALAEARCDALVVSDCPSVNWLFNLRAGDVPYLPILRAFALIERGKRPRLYADKSRFAPEALKALEGIAEIVLPSSPPGDGRMEIAADLERLVKTGGNIRLDADTAATLFSDAIKRAGGKPNLGADPIALIKAQKNPVELAGTRAAHLRDGAAVVRFLAWLDAALAAGPVTEIDAVIALEKERIATGALVDVSFPTIAGAGPNAALPHYRVGEKTNRAITPGLFLVDSGGQYRDGTTDITRTLAVGTTTRAMKDAYTRVLKGMIAVSRCVFPKGTSGAQIDAFARQFLWNAGKDFDHGTGHGVGSFLSVHEGPQRISKFGTAGLLPGMIVSNEPGYYREGRFGIRIENLIAVEPRAVRGGEREMLGFETLTWCPIDTRPVIRSMLVRDERQWLNHYHAETEARLAPLLEGAALAYLRKACAPL